MIDTHKVDATLAAHRIAGRRFNVAGINSFVREQGSGETVVLMHGLPTSSFLYRKVIPRLAEQGFRALCFDLPGLGLADRSVDIDYSIRGLSEFTAEAIDALGIDEYHLVVHDAGVSRAGAVADRAQHPAQHGPRSIPGRDLRTVLEPFPRRPHLTASVP